MTAHARNNSSGLGLAITIIILLAVVALGNIAIVTRADRHVEAKHGTSAREYIRKHGYTEAWYSDKREAFLLARCDDNSGMCALMFVGARGQEIDAQNFDPALLSGLLELTSYWCPRPRMLKVIARDGYRLLWRG